jgi:hypothetical protein
MDAESQVLSRPWNGRVRTQIFSQEDRKIESREIWGFEPQNAARRLLSFRTKPRDSKPNKPSDLPIFL